MVERFLRVLRESASSGPPPEPPAAPPETAAADVAGERGGPDGSTDLSPLVLAYLGDAVWELYVRLHLVRRAGRRRDLTRASTAWVSAVSQSRLLAALEPELSEQERAVVRRGRNANVGQIPKSAAMSEYRRATAFECLLGHLLVTGEEERLLRLLDRAAEKCGETTTDAG